MATLREVLLTLVGGRYPALVTRARIYASHMKTPEELKEVIAKIGLATTEEEAQQALLHKSPPSGKRGSTRTRKKK